MVVHNIIMMVGTSIGAKGGVSFVVQNYMSSGIMGRLNIRYYPTHCDGSRLKKVIFYIRGMAKIVRDTGGVDIIHIHTASWWSFRRLFLVILLGKIMGKAVIIHIHGAKFDIYYNNAVSIEKALIEKGLRLADKVVVLSHEWQKKISKFCLLEKIVVIQNTVPVVAQEETFSSAKLAGGKSVLFLGKLGKRKGVYDLLESIRILGSTGCNAKFLICGNGDITGVRKRVDEIGLQGLVIVPGWVSGSEKNELLRQAYVYVLPSYQEGMPMSILEAMGAGIPVIASSVGGIPEVVKDGWNGFLVPPGEPRLLADRLRQILEDENLWKKLSDNAFETIRDRFSMEETERRIGSLYGSLYKEKT